jgi:hypothetical protein
MKYINKNSNRGVVNLFADFIVQEINTIHHYDVVIEVTDCGKFFIVNGMTNSSKILDMVKVKETFTERYKPLLDKLEYETINIIDLILYDQELVKKDEHFFEFYNSSRPIYHHNLMLDIIENPQPKFNNVSYTNRLEYELDFSEENTSDLEYFTYSPLNITSEFPHGHSLSMGRLYFYYSEYICNQLFDVILTDQITFKFSLLKNEDGDNLIKISSNSIYKESDIISMVLDVFDFDLSKFQSTLITYDLIDDLAYPFEDKPWVIRDKIKDLILF